MIPDTASAVRGPYKKKPSAPKRSPQVTAALLLARMLAQFLEEMET